jgi:hypothetical protein
MAPSPGAANGTASGSSNRPPQINPNAPNVFIINNGVNSPVTVNNNFFMTNNMVNGGENVGIMNANGVG